MFLVQESVVPDQMSWWKFGQDADDAKTQFHREASKAGFRYTVRVDGYFYLRNDLEKYLSDAGVKADFTALWFYKDALKAIDTDHVQLYFADEDAALLCALTLG